MQEPSTETTSLTGKRRLTPMLQQYVNAKKECPEDAILLFRMGDFYELFFEDATVAARILDITLTARAVRSCHAPAPQTQAPAPALAG